MTAWVALLRGVNVGGSTTVPMAWLRKTCAGLDLTDVRTHLNSGNVVFTASGAVARKAVTGLEAALQEHTGRSVRVLLRSAADLAGVVDLDPFPDADPSRVVVLFAAGPLTEADLEAVRAAPGPAGWTATRTEVVLHYPQGLGRLRATDEPRLGVVVTARNLRTTRRLAEMAAHA